MQKTFQLLQKNTVVRIIAPGAGSPVPGVKSANSWEDLEKACELLRSWNLTPVYSSRIFGEELTSFYNFANTDENRYEDFVEAFSSDAAVIWSFRGGYGSDRIIRAAIKNNYTPTSPKLFIGFSDVTNLHSYILTRWQWHTLHALSLRQLALKLVTQNDITSTRDMIFGKKNQIDLTLTPLNFAAKQPQQINAQITGGNLTMIQTAFGTPWQAPIENNILLLEDVGEAPYRIARIFQQLLASDFLQSAKAIILGDFIPDTGMTMVMEEFASQCNIPVLRCEGIGHGKNNQPIPFGTPSQLFLGAECRLTSQIN
jgi:muramoyltetrapeptide carboxypeptidase